MSGDIGGSRTPEAEALAEEIEHTRQQLGDTVEALAAKADVNGRAQRKTAEVTGKLRGQARAAKAKVTEQAPWLRNETTANAAAAALAVLALTLAWLAVRRRR
jgi:Protein of unknown function (DUF3618)